MRGRTAWPAIVGIAAFGAGAAGYASRGWWQPQLFPPAADPEMPAAKADAHEANEIALSDTAKANLGIATKPAVLGPYWKTLAVPGTVIDRPAVSDRAVSAPAMGVVAEIHARPGDAVLPGGKLVTLRLTSESLQSAQAALFKNAGEAAQVALERERLAGAGAAVSEQRLLDKDSQLRRLAAEAQSLRQDLAARGLSAAQIAAAADGKFLRELTVLAPLAPTGDAGCGSGPDGAAAGYELQELKANLGDQVPAGQPLAVVANHRCLLVEGHAFPAETGLVERALRQGWAVRVEFVQEAPGAWASGNPELPISHLAATIDPASRTVSFFLPLENQGRPAPRGGPGTMVWRYRPGQRVRLRVPVEKLENVFVLPPGAVTYDGPEAYVFRADGAGYERVAVRIVHADARAACVANDFRIAAGQQLVQANAAALQRALKAKGGGEGGGEGGHGGHDHHDH